MNQTCINTVYTLFLFATVSLFLPHGTSSCTATDLEGSIFDSVGSICRSISDSQGSVFREAETTSCQNEQLPKLKGQRYRGYRGYRGNCLGKIDRFSYLFVCPFFCLSVFTSIHRFPPSRFITKSALTITESRECLFRLILFSVKKLIHRRMLLVYVIVEDI